ncbi:hypothetical protein ACOSQ4_000144 [Xanthoceras sorbifolium]
MHACTLSNYISNILSFMGFLAPLYMLWIYYATLKRNAYLLITINSVGCLVETIYIVLFIAYAPKKARILSLKLLLVLNFGGFVSILLLTLFLAKGSTRVKIRMVIRTKSVEFMPFSFIIISDVGCHYLPNILGIILGAVQMVLFLIYKYCKRVVEEQKQQDQQTSSMVNLTPNMNSATIFSSPPIGDKNEVGNKDQSLHI